ncbi:MAG TPA: diheme cytochrome c-553 [Puia sp.]
MRKAIFFIGAAIVMLTLVTNTACNETAARGEVKDSAQLVKRGEYLVSAMACDDCHSPKKMGPHGPELDMDRRFSGYPAGRPLPPIDTNTTKQWALLNMDGAAVGPWGVSFAANITSDPTGIGNWKEDQFIRCLREGKWMGLPDARPLLPPMPWESFSKLNDEDLSAIYHFLKTTKPVNNTAPAWIPKK